MPRSRRCAPLRAATLLLCALSAACEPEARRDVAGLQHGALTPALLSRRRRRWRWSPATLRTRRACVASRWASGAPFVGDCDGSATQHKSLTHSLSSAAAASAGWRWTNSGRWLCTPTARCGASRTGRSKQRRSGVRHKRASPHATPSAWPRAERRRREASCCPLARFRRWTRRRSRARRTDTRSRLLLQPTSCERCERSAVMGSVCVPCKCAQLRGGAAAAVPRAGVSAPRGGSGCGGEKTTRFAPWNGSHATRAPGARASRYSISCSLLAHAQATPSASRAHARRREQKSKATGVARWPAARSAAP